MFDLIAKKISRKIIFFQIIGLMIILIIAGILQYNRIQKTQYAEVEASGLRIAQTLREILSEHPELYTTDKLQSSVIRFVAKIPNVNALYLIDGAAKIIAHSDPKQLAKYADEPLLFSFLKTYGEQSHIHTGDGTNVMHIHFSIEGRYDEKIKSNIMGAGAIEINLDKIDKKINDALIETLVYLLLLIAIFTLLQTKIVISPFTKRLKNLTLAASKFGEGKYEVSAISKGKDETTVLGKVFNEMVEKRNEYEKNIKKLNERFNLVTTATNDTIYDWDLISNTAWWGEGITKSFGYPKEEIENTLAWFLDRVHQDDRELVSRSLDDAIGKGLKNWISEYQFRHYDGSYKTVYDRAFLLFDDDGNPIRFIGSIMDITAQKKAEEKISMLAQAVENSADCIAVLNTDYKVIYVNTALTNNYGFNLEEILNQPFSIVHSENNPEEITNEIINTLRKREAWNGEILNKRKDGTDFPVTISISPLLNEKGELTGSVGISRDITQQKKYEYDLKNAKEKAEEASRAKSEFLANISHELRTPLNGIIGMAEILFDTEINKNQERFIKNIKSSGESLLSIINDLLDFSKIDIGKLELNEVEFSIRNEIASILKPYGARAFNKGIELLYSVGYAIPEFIIGDNLRLQQIITNLVGNAIKFTERGSVILRVEEENRTEEKVEIHFIISDTGIGIPEEKQKLIFEAFTQADSSVSRQFGGTGLGLSISSSLVELFGGKIWVESQIGKGSDFHFIIPFKISQKSDFLAYREERLNGIPVLIVEDNATTSELLSEIIMGWGMKPKIVSRGEEAIEILRKELERNNPYQLMLLDLRLPGIDGITVAEILKKDNDFMNLPIIIISMSHNPSDYDWANKLNIDAFFTKPFSHSELFETIQSVLLKRQRREDQIVNVIKEMKNIPEAVEEFEIPELNILCAEDNEINQEIIIELLTKKNHKVTIAKNGQVAVNFYLKKNYDLILMDIQMPVMDGLTATQVIREKEKETKTHIPIIALTARAMKDDKEKCLKAGMDGYVSKPIRPKELFKEIHSFFSADQSLGKENNLEMDLAINIQSALDYFSGDSKMLIKLANIFIDKSPKIFEEFENSFNSEDRKKIRDAAHKFKGSLPVFTPPAFMEYLIRFQEEIREGALALAKEKLPFVKKNYLAILERTIEMVKAVGSLQ